MILKKIFAYSFIYLVLLFLYLPVFVLIAFSFTNSANLGIWNGFSFDLYTALFKDSEIMIAVGNTLIIAVISAVVATVLGTLGAIGTFYSKKRTRGVIEGLTQIPVVNAEIVMALSLTVMFVFLGSYVFRSSLFSFWTLLIGHVCLAVPFVYLNVKPKLMQMDLLLFFWLLEIYLLFQYEYSANFLFTLWKRVRKYGAFATGITQNVEDLLQSHTARTMLANSEFIIMLNQASTDRVELAKLLNISDLQMSYITNVGAGEGLIKVGSSLVPFSNRFPKNTELYKLMTTRPGEVVNE